MRAHEAGALHGDLGTHGPSWLRAPEDVNALLPQLWPRTVRRASDGALRIGEVSVHDLAQEYGTPAYVLDEEDLRARCREFAAAFGDADVYYAGKSFLCRAVVRVIEEEGLFLDVCTGGELAVALAAGFPAERIGFHGNNKSMAELEAAVEAGVGRIVIDSFDEIARLHEITDKSGAKEARGADQGERGAGRGEQGAGRGEQGAGRGEQGAGRGERGVPGVPGKPKVLVRVTVGVEAHTHEFIATAHEDQKFGFSLAGGAAFEAAAQIIDAGKLDLVGLHSHIGSQIFDTSGFEVAARRVLSLQAQIRDARGVELPELDLGGGFGIAYTTQDDPSTPGDLAKRINKIVESECDAASLRVPRLSIEPGRAIVAPSVFTLYQVGTIKDVDGIRTYVSVDGGMSDNIRTALYDASYSATVAGRSSVAEPMLARVVGKHCESGDIVVKDEFLPADVQPGDLLAVPGTGAYCRSMASNYNHVPRPPVIAVRDGASRVIVRRETVEDLLALDVG